MKTQILYGGNDVFANLPTPFVGKQDSFVRLHDRWLTATDITLNGQITGSCSNSFSEIITKQNELLNNFSRDYLNLTITENGNTLYTAPYCVISNISFPQDKYVRVVPYEISLRCFQQDLFSGVYGVQNPSQTIGWVEQDDGIVVVTRSISARGFNTSSANKNNNAFNNAKNYVQAITGWSTSYFSDALPAFITYNTSLTPCVRTLKENINRLEGFYGVDIEYSYNPLGTSSNILKYTLNTNYNVQNGIYESSINGTFEGCPDADISTLRAAYNNIDLYSIANFELKKQYNSAPNLNPEYLVEQVEENSKKKILSFQKSWDTDPRGLVLFDYEITADSNLLDDLNTISIRGTISARNSQQTNWVRVKNYYENQLNILKIIKDFYIFKGFPYQINNYPLSFSVVEDEIAATIEINASYNDRLQPPYGFDDGSYTIEISPPIRQYVPVPVLCGQYKIIDTNSTTRGKISVNGEVLKLSNTDQGNNVRNFLKSVLAQNIPSSLNRVLKQDNLNTQQVAGGYRYNGSVAETYEGEAFSL